MLIISVSRMADKMRCIEQCTFFCCWWWWWGSTAIREIDESPVHECIISIETPVCEQDHEKTTHCRLRSLAQTNVNDSQSCFFSSVNTSVRLVSPSSGTATPREFRCNEARHADGVVNASLRMIYKNVRRGESCWITQIQTTMSWIGQWTFILMRDDSNLALHDSPGTDPLCFLENLMLINVYNGNT